jgi:hypothetical protein
MVFCGAPRFCGTQFEDTELRNRVNCFYAEEQQNVLDLIGLATKFMESR